MFKFTALSVLGCMGEKEKEGEKEVRFYFLLI